MANLTKAQIAEKVKVESKTNIQNAKESIAESKKRIEKAKAEIKSEKSKIKNQKALIRQAKNAAKNAKQEAKDEAKTKKSAEKAENHAKLAEKAADQLKDNDDKAQPESASKTPVSDLPEGKYYYKKTGNDNFVFNLAVANGQAIMNSQTYTSLDACGNGISSVKTNAPIAEIEDQTVSGYTTLPCPKFEVYIDAAGAFRYRLKAKNGQNIAASAQSFSDKAACLDSIETVRKLSASPSASAN